MTSKEVENEKLLVIGEDVENGGVGIHISSKLGA